MAADGRSERQGKIGTRRAAGASATRPERATPTGAFLVAMLVLAMVLPVVEAAPAGKVVFARGVATAQAEGRGARVLATGSPLHEGDVVSTAKRSFAVLRLADGTRMTLRPDSVFEIERLRQEEESEEESSAVMRLFKGGLRAITGLIAKRAPNAFRVNSSSATIGIRGTEFEARLCGPDCLAEARRTAGGDARSGASAIVARLVFLRGRALALDLRGGSRRLHLGASLFQGDVVETQAGGIAVVAFRDGTRTTLRADTRVRIERVHYEQDEPEEGSMFLRLVRGGLRAVTGAIAKARRDAVQVATPSATIGIRGTGFDVVCQGECGGEASAARSDFDPWARLRALLGSLIAPAVAADGDGLYVSVWDGTIVLRGAGGDLVIGRGRTVFLPADGGPPVDLPEMPVFLREGAGPRPDSPESTEPGLEDPFAAVEQDGPVPGLYVTVYEGDVTLEGEGGGRVDLGPGEAGYVDPEETRAVRLTRSPRVVATPPPDLFENEEIRNIFRLLNDDTPAGETEFECVIR